MTNEEKIVELTPNGKNALKLGLVSGNVSDLMGKVLTIIDASLEGEKKESVKSLIRDAFYRKQDWFAELAYWVTPKEQEDTIKNDWEDGLVSIFEE